MLSTPLQYYQNDTIHEIRQDTHCSGIPTSIPKIELWIGRQQAQFCAPLLSKLIDPPMRAAIHRPRAHVTTVENPYPEQTESKDSDSAVEI